MSKVKTEKIGKKIDMQKVLAPAALVILYILFAIVGNNFFTWDTAENILQSAYYIGFMAFGVTFIIITGGIDLSLGTVMMCSALIGAYAFNAWGLPLWVGVVITLAVATGFGVINGYMIAKLGLPPFIATLGSQMVSMGIGSIITKVQAQTWPAASAEVGGWFKKVLVRTKVFDMIPVGAIWLLVFFVIPVKMKWLAWLDIALFGLNIVLSILSRNIIGVVLPLVALLNFAVFIWPEVKYQADRFQYRHSRQTVQFKKAVKQQQQQKGYHHKCCVCGKTDADYPDMTFRYCSKCAGYHCYCQDHIFSHVHFEEE